ncbi:sigma factor-like helix-turn-helix DNA-binding protein [Candidatus Hepatoplasma crinochetorum]|jgi:predicted DNA-binding protein YlxM (UPF0122 family)|uniref:UPF0122 protein X271_00475 n=1 Tax=Candidatus Hepatoplasma crinochetorum Av TaxID=1427984 RepID=W8GT27_9MOLU|nr:sigma factor-like helix-turn-helix DNA-binding protein [Candidatus Hepatoplasma crinochetorum]AHK22580.1 putative helix-turn-helix protein, YlxM/p13 family protein [Candidatus Hepatoplasma crinochetorum Av]BDV03163.1 MAG: hypothetical protein HCTKY_4570 [Candidatus Hepatoplasma crinochetorum]
MNKKINKLSKLTEYYDLYKLLLTNLQQEIFELYYFEDFSLSEIANNRKVARSTIHDILKSVEKNLIQFEDKLKLNYQNKKLLKLILKIKDQDLQDDFFNLLKKY